ncbi:response regulator [Oscillatoria sp. FACHB-1407]|uniref:hybrid sensor histidine kinase/response regulator n=1 Tax=Oscillatoria sp. FACHB-1407 TaxID=2692847 RepID=UPI0016887F35|nr:response regulator [Oscillatoria sp. FACHB-1407]MBD2465902.1 response regulator [Oscillatoria sp. FACHB-1407]
MLRILLIDDNADDRALAIRVLSHEFPDTQITEITNAEELAQALTGGGFDIVVTDYLLRWSDGIQVLQRIKSQHPNCPVVMFTNSGSQEIAVEAMKSGLDDYVIKSPQRLVRLAIAVRRAYERAEERRKSDRLELRLQSLLNQLDVGVFRSTLNGQIVEANAAFLKLLSVETLAEAQMIQLAELFDSSLDIVQLLERLKQDGHLPAQEIQLRRANGSTVWVCWSKTLNRLDNETFIDSLVEDITSRKQAELSLQFLAEAGAILSSSLDYETTLAQITQLVVPQVADWCAIDLIEPNQTVRRTVLTHQDPDKVKLGQELQQRYPVDLNASQGIGRVLQTGKTERYPIITDEQLVASARDADHLRILRELGLKSAIVVPLQAHGRILGTITFVSAESGRVYSSTDQILAEELARRAALAIDNAHLYDVAQQERATAQSASRLKDEFLATLSHELRTPLNAILGWSRMLRTSNLNPTMLNNALETIERNAKLQTQLVEDILNVSKIINGKLRLNVRPISLIPVIYNALEPLEAAINAKGITLETYLDGSVGFVAGDSDRLQQVIWNMLSNAVKFTPGGGQIEIHLERVDTCAQIKICDTGIGIKADFLAHVFERFSQADGSTTRKYGGLGLGLAVARHLIELHGGSIQAESAGEGQGATFTIRLPLLPVTNKALTVEQSSFQETDNSEGIENRAILDGLRILLVEDETDGRELVIFILQSYGADVVAVSSVSDALKEFAQQIPDLLIIDISMPNENGYDLIRQVRLFEASRSESLTPAQGGQIPAIALTAYASEEERQQAIASGFQAHISKPIDPDDLVIEVANLIEKN